MASPIDFSRNIERFTGFAGLYDQHRARPPAALALLVAQHTGLARPELVVDLGCGTGLSTRYWADKAGRVIGIEPAGDMRQQAEAVTPDGNVEYREGFSHQTSLPDRCAQVVMCMQALHWMEPEGTFAEAARILQPGGVFVACDYDWPPMTGSWEADAAFAKCFNLARRLEKERRTADGVQHWDKAGHFTRLQASGRFRYLKETALHHQDTGDAGRLVGLYLSQGFVVSLRKAGVTDEELGLPGLRETAGHFLGNVPRPFLWSAAVRLGVV